MTITAAQVALSRRVAHCKEAPCILMLGFDGWDKMLEAIEQAASFDDLPKQYQDLIVQAEQEIKDGTPVDWAAVAKAHAQSQAKAQR